MFNTGDKLNYLPTREMIQERKNFLSACKNNDASAVFSFVGSKHIHWNEAIEAVCNNGVANNHELLLQIIHEKRLKKEINISDAIITIYLSSMHNKQEVIRLLLNDKKTTPSMENIFLCWVEHNDIPIIQEFSHIEPNHDEYITHALHMICRSNYIGLLKHFTTKHTIEQSIINQGFVYACEFGHLSIVQYLLTQCGADIHFNYDSGLRKAGKNNHLEVVQYLLNSDELKEHADATAVNDDLSITAIMHKNYQLFDYLHNDYGLPLTERVKEYKEFKNF